LWHAEQRMKDELSKIEQAAPSVGSSV